MAELVAVALPLELGEQTLKGRGVLCIDSSHEALKKLLIFRELRGDMSEVIPLANVAGVEVGVYIAAEPGTVEDAMLAAEPAADEAADGKQANAPEDGLKDFGILCAEGFGSLGKSSFIGSQLSYGCAGLLDFEQFVVREIGHGSTFLRFASRRRLGWRRRRSRWMKATIHRHRGVRDCAAKGQSEVGGGCKEHEEAQKPYGRTVAGDASCNEKGQEIFNAQLWLDRI